jgi:hypothetical protein
MTEIYDKPLGFRTSDVPDPYKEGPQSDAEPVAWREALEQQLLDLVELARDTRSDKGGEARWTHPIGTLAREFANRITAPPRPDAPACLTEAVDISEQVWQALCARADASAGLIEAAELAEECASECLEDRKAPLSAYALRDFAKLLRARAADRSEK